jgi:hypothetical protein
MAAGIDTSPGVGASKALNDYWTKGAGAAQWVNDPHPYTRLVELLRKHVPEGMVHGLAAEYYHRVFGKWPGKHRGDK